MELSPIDQQATSSSAPLPHQQPSTSTPPAESKVLRSSARVKAKQKGKGKGKERQSFSLDTEPFQSSQAIPFTSTTAVSRTSRSTSSPSKSKRNRDQSPNKGQSRDVPDESTRTSKRPRRTTLSTATPLRINEPARDPKGKKRAVPETSSEEEDTTSGLTSKRTRTSAYPLRSRIDNTLSQPPEMTRKLRTSTAKGKMAVKNKAMAASSSRLDDDNTGVLDHEYKHQESDSEQRVEDSHHQTDERDEDADSHESGPQDEAPANSDEAPPPPESKRDPPGPDDAAMAIFGDYRQFGNYMMGVSTRLKSLLTNIKSTADPTTRLLALQELSELLSISTEDTLAGSFQVESFVRELVKILGGRGVAEDDDDDGDDEPPEADEDASLAAALALSAGGAYQGDENLEAQVLACRCLANLMEALPGVAHTVVYHGAIPVLCSKLVEISYIDLAEQTLSTLEKISEEFPSSIVREGGLAALLNYLDFFSIAVQRTALQAAANCCRNVSAEHFSMIRGVWPIIRNCLTYSDQRLVEFASLCVIRVIDSYHRASVENLESLVDTDLTRAINVLLLPAGGSPLIAGNTYTQFLRALATSARASAKITIALLEADITDTLYQILTGVLPSPEGRDVQLGTHLTDMTVMDNLAHRPKDQVEEALSLVSELMPPLPKDGVFDHKSYTEKSLGKLIKARAKAERTAARQANAASHATAAPSPTPAATGQEAPCETDAVDTQAQDNAEDLPLLPPVKEATSDRVELLRSKFNVVDRFMRLIVPVLVDVYAASVIVPVRVKSLTALLKAISFLDCGGIKRVLKDVPVASFASSMLSTKDHPSLVIGALQLVDLLLTKVPEEYKPTFRREGVFHEVESLASRNVTKPKEKEKEKDKEKDASESSSAVDAGSLSLPPPPAISSLSTLPGFKKLTSLSLEPEDAITLRARVIRFKHLMNGEREAGDNAFNGLRSLVGRLGEADATEETLREVLKELSEHFASPHTSVSSFELLQSGLVDGLLQFMTVQEHNVSIQKRREILLDAFATRRLKGVPASHTPFGVLVKKLQESLTRIESFEVVTVAQGVDDSKRSSPSLLARQLRLRLVAGDDSDIPRNLHNIVVSIHAIATFQALHDYLRPRVSGLLSGNSRLSGMLAALAVSGFGPGASSRGAVDEPRSTKSVPVLAPVESSLAAASSATSEPSAPPVRRSQRLSAKSPVATSESPLDLPPSEGSLSEASAERSEIDHLMAVRPPDQIAGERAQEPALTPDFSGEEVDAELFDDEVGHDQSAVEKTVHLSVAEDGSNVEAQTPDGTRVSTPSVSRDAAQNANRLPSSTRSSYAAALKSKPSDWHLEFSMDDQVLPLDLTIYGAVYQHETRKKTGALSLSMIWQGMYTVKFKKVTGPPPSSEQRADGDALTKTKSPGLFISSLPDDTPHAKILHLLKVLHKLNTLEAERSAFTGEKRYLAESAFVNNKLTAKLTRQLEEPLIVASSCLPDWALDLPQHFPFLFPFATRYNFLQSTSFGYARLILKWQSQQSRGQDVSRRDDGIGFLGRLQRQKVRISRKHILESAVKVFELYGSSSSILEVEYFEEVGTGLGPTLEFYSLVSKEFARRDLKIWRDADPTLPTLYVHHPSGLFPAPISLEDSANDGEQKKTHVFRVIGQFVAKAMLDSRIIDLHFNKIFLKLILGDEVPLTIASLRLVDKDLANSLSKLEAFARPHGDQKVAIVEGVQINDLALDFTIPGYDIELRPGGRNLPVTSENISEYISEVIDAIIGTGAQPQARAFREGFSKVFPIFDLQAFSADELVTLFGNSDEDWSTECLTEAIKADHGFNVESRAIRDLVEIMSEYDASARREFLQFITGSPKLPIGGFRGLNPLLTVVRKPHEPPLTSDDYLPSVMTCVNYLKLPEYSSKAVMREKLRLAMCEGVGSFHLS